MNKIEFFVEGTPKGQPRPKAASRFGYTRVYDPGTAEGWKSLVATMARPHLPEVPIDVPVELSVYFYLPRPKRLSRKKDPQQAIIAGVKPDFDNAVKAVMDILTSIGMWRDDALVAIGHVYKYFHAVNGKPGALIQIKEIE